MEYIASEKIEIGQFVYLHADGKLRPRRTKDVPAFVAPRAISKDDAITLTKQADGTESWAVNGVPMPLQPVSAPKCIVCGCDIPVAFYSVMAGPDEMRQVQVNCCESCAAKLPDISRANAIPLPLTTKAILDERPTCAEQTGKAIAELLEPLSDDERGTAMCVVFDTYCDHCWRIHPEGGRRCQCWNDE